MRSKEDHHSSVSVVMGCLQTLLVVEDDTVAPDIVGRMDDQSAVD